MPNVRDIITVTNRELIFKTEDEYREISHLPGKPINNSFILEPFGRNTAPAIAADAVVSPRAPRNKADRKVFACIVFI